MKRIFVMLGILGALMVAGAGAAAAEPPPMMYDNITAMTYDAPPPMLYD